jgi:hypothetical protein
MTIDTLESAAERAIAAKRAGGSRIEVRCADTQSASAVNSEVFPGCAGVVLGRVPETEGQVLVCSVAIADVLRVYGIKLQRELLGDDRVPRRTPKLSRRPFSRG